LLWLWAATTGLLLVKVFANGVEGWAVDTPTSSLAQPAQVDLNRARVAELVALPGIGRQRALAIVLHRVRHGPFVRLSDLLQIDGIGQATLDELATQVMPLPGDAR